MFFEGKKKISIVEKDWHKISNDIHIDQLIWFQDEEKGEWKIKNEFMCEGEGMLVFYHETCKIKQVQFNLKEQRK